MLQQGTTNGTSTDGDGRFSLNNVPGTATLVFSAVGSLTQQIPLNGRTTLEIRLAANQTALNEVVVTGSRATEGRSNILTNKPVDVISAREIKAYAQTDVTQILTYNAPSFQSTRQTVTDGTDVVDPTSLRGLGPGQVLVLVNGKRRHTSGLVNINGTPGRGSVGTDMNVLPPAAIKRIEVLRDGAAAQYGSDAIAGVINIQLKDDTTGISVSSTAGQTAKSDGRLFQADANLGFGLNHRGFVNVSGQFSNRSYVDRSGLDTAPLIYLGTSGGGYPGYQPQDATNKSRTNVAGYLDLESDITDKLLLNVAGRAERYSDFGSNVSGKVAARYSILDGLALRGAISNGFRAPSLQQRYFTNSSTQFASGVLRDVLTTNNDSLLTRAFGIESLKQEKSNNYSVGLTARVLRIITLTVDAYQIDIRDRIVLSSQFNRDNAVVNTLLGTLPVQGIQFFANAVNTRTQGIGIVANERLTLGPDSRLTLTAAANFNEATVRSFNSSSFIDSNPNLQNTLFDRAQRVRLENGQPRSKINLSADYGYKIFGLSLRTVRFGEVQTTDPNPARSYIDQTFSAKWVTDLTISAQVSKNIGLSAGVNNLFNIYPDRLYQDPNNNEQSLTYSTLDGTNRSRFLYNSNQFDFNGAFYFSRVNFTL